MPWIESAPSPDGMPAHRFRLTKPIIKDPYSVDGRAKIAVIWGICGFIFCVVVFLVAASKMKKPLFSTDMALILSLVVGAFFGIAQFVYTGMSANEIAGRKAFWKKIADKYSLELNQSAYGGWQPQWMSVANEPDKNCVVCEGKNSNGIHIKISINRFMIHGAKGSRRLDEYLEIEATADGKRFSLEKNDISTPEETITTSTSGNKVLINFQKPLSDFKRTERLVDSGMTICAKI